MSMLASLVSLEQEPGPTKQLARELKRTEDEKKEDWVQARFALKMKQ